MNKLCVKCNTIKNLTEFYKTSGSSCKLCTIKFMKKYNLTYRKETHTQERGKRYYQKYKEKIKEKVANLYKEKREILIKLKSEPCADCKQSFPPECMDFDHLRDKIQPVSHFMRGSYPLSKMLEEISKCELVCSNCHRIRTSSRKSKI